MRVRAMRFLARCGGGVLLAAVIGTSGAQDAAADRELLSRPLPPAATSSASAAQAWREREGAAARTGNLEARVEALRQLADAAATPEERFAELDRLISALSRGGLFARQLAEMDRLIEDRKVGPGRRAIVAANLAGLLAISGQTERSLRTIARGKSLAADAGADELELLGADPLVRVLNAEASIAERRGDLQQAERVSQQLIDRALGAHADPQLSARRRAAGATTFLSQVWNHGLYLERLGRRDEALALARHARLFAAANLGGGSAMQRAAIDYAEARALNSSGDYEGAWTRIESALAGFRSAGVHEHENNHALARRQRALAALALGRLDVAAADLEVVRAARASNPVFAGNTTVEEIEGLFALAKGDLDEAMRHSAERVATALRWQGRDNSHYKAARAQEVIVRLADARSPVPAAFLESYLDLLASPQWADGTQRAIEIEALAVERVIDHPATPTALAFRAAEILRMDASQGALVAGAAKMAAATPELRALIEQEQAITSDAFERRRAAAQALQAAERNQTDEIVLRRQRADAKEKSDALAASDQRLAAVRAEIARRFPRYREIVSPQVPGAAEIARVLRPDEVYVNLFAGRASGHAFLVSPTQGLQHWRVPMARAEADRLAQRFRAAFDRGSPPARPGDLGGLDVEAGAALHAAWLAPLFARIGEGQVVVLAASGPLVRVPWPALPAGTGTAWPRSDWAGARATLVAMPSASSLMLLRSLPFQPAAMPLLAFADPSFDGGGARPASLPAVRAAAVAAAVRAGPAFDYRTVTPLPETLDEARAIASALGADASAILSGRDATRSRALRDDLSRARTLVFATHGLVPGEIPGFHKAGLAMAYEGRGLADSILTVDDVTGLKLNAEVVVLSACNTGFATGGAGDSVSALARAFFIAGARSVMVTAWAVDSFSAKELTSRTFAVLKSQPALGRAQALAQAQRDLMAGRAGELYRHPYFWAPYFLAGDGAR